MTEQACAEESGTGRALCCVTGVFRRASASEQGRAWSPAHMPNARHHTATLIYSALPPPRPRRTWAMNSSTVTSPAALALASRRPRAMFTGAPVGASAGAPPPARRAPGGARRAGAASMPRCCCTRAASCSSVMASAATSSGGGSAAGEALAPSTSRRSGPSPTLACDSPCRSATSCSTARCRAVRQAGSTSCVATAGQRRACQGRTGQDSQGLGAHCRQGP